MFARLHALRDAALSRDGGWARVCAVAREYGIGIRVRRALGVREITVNGVVYIDAEQPPLWRLFYGAHGLGHVYHAGDQRFLARHCFGVVEKQEEFSRRYGLYLLAPVAETEEDLADLPLELWSERIALEAVCGEMAA